MPKKMVNITTPKMVSLYQSCIGSKIRRLQKRLAKKAIRKPEHRFSDLFNLMYDAEWVEASLKLVLENKGSSTAGSDGITKEHLKDDKRKEAFIRSIVYEIKNGIYKPEPARRIYIKKESGGKRPLSIPSPRDKILQECVRLILEAIYEPRFHENSHGFRSGRSCHTALESLRRNWVGTKWVIEVDIAECFERIDHYRLLDILRERIQDDRFLNLIRKFLKAGYMENWIFNRTYSGTPQGSVISPILTNIYLDKLDWKLQATSEQYHKGERRRQNGKRTTLFRQRKRLLSDGETNPSLRDSLKKEIRELNQQILSTQGNDFHDADYTRVKFIRYADDVRIGIIGPKRLAKQVLQELAIFLKENLHLELNRGKTGITHLPTEKASFLGYEFKTSPPRLRRRNLREKGSPHNVVQTVKTGSGNIQLLVPLRKISKKLSKYMANGQPQCLDGLINQPVAHIIDHYNGVIQGWYNFYQLGVNVCRLNYARYVLLYSLAKTLARKEGSSVSRIFRKYGKDITITKPNGREVHFVNQPLTQVRKAKATTFDIDTLPTWWPRQTRTRLLENCAICDSKDKIEMHHVRHIRKRGENVSGFTLYLAAQNRKQIPVCLSCHQDIHKGKYDGANLASILERLRQRKSVNRFP